MNKNDYVIRLERKEEYRKVEELVRESFWNVYRPGCLEHYLLNQLRKNADFVKELDFVMEKDGELIGQNVFVKAIVKADDNRDIPIMTMGPVLHQSFSEKAMERFCLIIPLQKQHRSAAELCALKVILIFMEKAASHLLAILEFDTMVYLKMQMTPFFFAKN